MLANQSAHKTRAGSGSKIVPAAKWDNNEKFGPIGSSRSSRSSRRRQRAGRMNEQKGLKVQTKLLGERTVEDGEDLID